MTKSDLIEKLQRQFPDLSSGDVKVAVNKILERMGNALAAGDRCELRGFGSFSTRARPPRVGRNPRTGETVEVGGKIVPHFKAGQELRDRVDGKKSDRATSQFENAVKRRAA